jgi:hypothetical protein
LVKIPEKSNSRDHGPDTRQLLVIRVGANAEEMKVLIIEDIPPLHDIVHYSLADRISRRAKKT